MNWLKRLMDMPLVAVLAASPRHAELDIAGVSAQAMPADGAMCIGLRLNVAQLDHDWYVQASLALAAAQAASDDALQCDGGVWWLWRRYELIFPARVEEALGERVMAHLALARYLESGPARLEAIGIASEIGKLV